MAQLDVAFPREAILLERSQEISQKMCKTLSTMSNIKSTDIKYVQLYLEILHTLMDFISMDLVGPFETFTKEISTTLTMMCMLTNSVICVPIQDKSAGTVVSAYLKEVYFIFDGSGKILSDNGDEFKYSLFSKVAIHLGIKHPFLFPYRPRQMDA